MGESLLEDLEALMKELDPRERTRWGEQVIISDPTVPRHIGGYILHEDLIPERVKLANKLFLLIEKHKP